MAEIIWNQKCLQQNHNFIGGERIKFLKLEPQDDNKLTCDTCKNYGDWKAITVKDKVWCNSCYDDYESKQARNKNSNEEIKQAIKKMKENNINFFSDEVKLNNYVRTNPKMF